MAGIITRLEAQKRNKERVNVYLDGEFAFGLALSEALKLRKGQQLTDAEIARLRALDEIEVAHERALNFLSYRPRSISEVRDNLRQKEFSAEAVETVVGRLEQVGLLDDRAFAQFWIDNRDQFNPRGARALRFELRQKGVPDDAIDQALAGFDEDAAARQAAQSQARRVAGLDEKAFRQKVNAYLQRRGFSYDAIRDAADTLWLEIGDDQGENTRT